MTKPPPSPCAWCGDPAVAEREIVPAKRTRTGELVTAARTAPVCTRHSAMVDRDIRQGELERRAARLRGKAGTSGSAEAELRRVEGELARLQRVSNA